MAEPRDLNHLRRLLRGAWECAHRIGTEVHLAAFERTFADAGVERADARTGCGDHMDDSRAAYEEWHAALGIHAGAEVPWHDLVRRHLPDVACLPVLDVGCGRGGSTEWLARRRPALVLCADLALTAVRKAIAFARTTWHRGLRIEVAEAAWLPHADATFDLIASRETAERLPNYIAAVRAVPSALRPFGTLLDTPSYTGAMGALSLCWDGHVPQLDGCRPSNQPVDPLAAPLPPDEPSLAWGHRDRVRPTRNPVPGRAPLVLSSLPRDRREPVTGRRRRTRIPRRSINPHLPLPAAFR